jgi:hypothetical protein
MPLIASIRGHYWTYLHTKSLRTSLMTNAIDGVYYWTPLIESHLIDAVNGLMDAINGRH